MISNRESIGGEIFMKWRSLTMQTAAALTGLMLSVTVAHAAEVKVLTSVALTNVLDELAPTFEKRSGNKLTISYDLAAVQKKRILDGERADVIILPGAMMDDLAKQNKLAPGNIVNVASTPVALQFVPARRSRTSRQRTRTSKHCCQPSQSPMRIRPREA
jgi:ABC-type molybdate transport system substrate-binding protein